MIRVTEERREIQAVIFTATGELRESFSNNDTFQSVLDLAEKETGKKQQLFHQKLRVNEEDAIGSWCEGDVCELQAFDPDDDLEDGGERDEEREREIERKRLYFCDGMPKTEKEDNYESEGEIMDGIDMFGSSSSSLSSSES